MQKGSWEGCLSRAEGKALESKGGTCCLHLFVTAPLYLTPHHPPPTSGPAGSCCLLPSWPVYLLHGLLCIPSPLFPSLCLSPYPSPIFVYFPHHHVPPFPDLFKSRGEHYPHSPTPEGQGFGPSSNPRPLHSQPLPQEPGAGMGAGGCLWSSAGLQTHVDKGARAGRRGCQCPRIPVCEKAMLACVLICTYTYTHGHTPPPSPPASRTQGSSPLPGVSTVRLAGASTWPRALRARQR